MGLEAATIGYIISAVSLAATTAGSVVSYNQQKSATRQTELNAKAAAEAAAAEQRRKSAEMQENQRRLAIQGKRERASMLADLVGTGLVTSTGTPLALMADTITQQSMRMGDYSTQAGLEQSRIGAQGLSILQEGRSQARMMRSQAGSSLAAGLISSASSAASLYKPRNTGTVTVGGMQSY